MTPRWRLGWYFRARLQRRIFLAFGASILVTAGLVFAFSWAVGVFQSPWRREAQGLHRFVGHRFARVWDDPTARDELADSMARGFDLSVVLTDPHHRPLATFGPPCGRHLTQTDVVRGDRLLGYVGICHKPPSFLGPRFYGGLVLIPICLWAASGLIARRLSQPMVELTRVAQEIGAGKLSSRVELGRNRHDEVGVLADVMNDMAARVEKQMADQRALLATVSHEIRTPLARMRILLEMSREGHDPKVIDDLDREVVEMDALVAELLASSRLDFGALRMAELDPRRIATEAVERAGIDPTLLCVEEGVGKIRGDATLLGRAVTNLLENAKRHAGGVASVRVTSRPGFVTFEVEDDGPGLDEEDEARLFEPFYKGKSEDARSVGLGLSLVKRIAEAHGGTAFAKNRSPKGARIGFEVSEKGADDGGSARETSECAREWVGSR